MPSVLGRIHSPDIGLAVWQRFTRPNLPVFASTVLLRPPFAETVVGTPDLAARRLCHDLLLFPPAAFWRVSTVGRPLRVSRLVTYRQDAVRACHRRSCRKFHVDAVGLRLLCTYAGPGTERVEADGKVRRMASMEVAIFKGTAFPDAGSLVLHRSPPLSSGTLERQSRLVLCIDGVP